MPKRLAFRPQFWGFSRAFGLQMLVLMLEKGKIGQKATGKYRTLFFRKARTRSVRKNGGNPPVPCRKFRAPKAEDFAIEFTNDSGTQVGAYPVWNLFCQRIGLNQVLARALRWNRGPRSFTTACVGRFLIDSKVLGAERLKGVDIVRLDPLLCQASGIRGLPSWVAIAGFFKEHHLEALRNLGEGLTKDLFCNYVRRFPKKQRNKLRTVILDYDSTIFTVYGKQEGADRGYCFRKKDRPGYGPRFAFLGELGLTLHHELLPQVQTRRRASSVFTGRPSGGFQKALNRGQYGETGLCTPGNLSNTSRLKGSSMP